MKMPSRSTHGFTLIEMLVAMAILGIVLSALLSMQSSTLKFTASASSQAKRMQTLQETGDYLIDRVRSAAQIGTNVNLSVGSGTSFTCSTATAASTCFVLVAPDRNAKPQYLVYRVIPRRDLAPADKRPDAWADDHVLALVEYRGGTTAVPSSFTDPIPPSLSLTGVTPNVVLDYLSVDFVNASFPALFKFDPTSGQAVLNLQVKQQERGIEKRTPSTQPLSMTVYSKNRQ